MLRRLEIKGTALLLQQAFTILGSSLEVLLVAPSRTSSLAPKQLACRLPRLHTLISTFGSGTLLTAGWEMPSLRTLHIEDPFDLESCIEKTGHHLRYLSIQDPNLVAGSLSRCSNLRELAIDFGNPSGDCNSLVQIHPHSSIRRIVLRNFDFVIWSQRRQHPLLPLFLPWIFSSAVTFPSLECIRFLLQDEASPRGEHSIHMVKKWFHSCQARGVQVQYCRVTADDIWQPFTLEFVERNM